MWNLFRAEWTKTYKRPANIGLFLVTLGIILLGFLGMVGISLYEGMDSQFAEQIRQLTLFPTSLQVPLIVLSQLGSILAIVFMSNSIGAEYTNDTWKVLLPRRARRSDFIIIKVVICLLFMTVLIATSLILGALLGVLANVIVGGDISNMDQFSASGLFKSLVPIFLQLIVFSSITLLVTMASRSTVMGIVFGIVGNTIFSVAASLSKLAAKILPNLHISNLEANWLYDGEQKTMTLGMLEGMFGTQVSLTTSIIVVAAYIFGSIIFGILLFQRRDMAGQ
ncbi:ABC transporter permease subunit [Herpetosiphon sp. NSE202]|uniref:ABC transporter permease subunit n=1 Tax=Herpetosiphon sp. NSE202 TaxID=3351349 RepID=UPI0036278D08